ncbi:transcriptional regulator, TetR family [Schaalia georgiae F0490]|uniref:Transcriptional regulator, TetR family n=1 Tax=Schaalia georgiae F0490 TaxID=1125717 RepID=J0NT03_9ACTO|nr:TetR/AcrR family transcriptional regulator [Schaalia georgiae]EJF47977.1 transcriptional regulator, TetR family [Schaalia georgiae F0490]
MPGGAPRARTLTRERIFAAALALVDEEGLAALSLRALGKRLGVSQTAFYRYVPDKAALLEGVSEEVWRLTFERFLSAVEDEPETDDQPEAEGEQEENGRLEDRDQPSAGGEAATESESFPGSGPGLVGEQGEDWRWYVRQYATALHDTLLQHPEAVVLLLTHPISTPEQLTLLAKVMVRLSNASFMPPVDMLAIITAVSVYTTGFAAAEAVPPVGGGPDETPDDSIAAAIASLPADDLSALRGLIGQVMDGQWDFAAQFERGLDALLRGWR